MPTPDRRAEIQQRIGAETGIDEAMIARVVHGFYDRVRADPMLAPIFDARITGADWPAHLGQMVRFWSAVILMDGRYHGRPMQKHAPLAIDARHFDRWLALFRATVADLVPATAAAAFIARAERIAESLEAGIALAQGRDLGRAGGFRLPGAAP